MRTQRHPQRRPGPPACSREQRAVRRDLARRRLYRPRRLRWALGHAGRARGAPGQPAAQAASHANRPPSLRSWRPGINVGPLMASVGGAGVIIGLAGQSLMQVRGRRVSWRSVALLPPPPRSRVLMRPAERGLGAHAVHVTPLHRGGPHSAAGGRRAGGRGAWRQRRVAWWTWGGGSHAPPPPPPPPPTSAGRGVPDRAHAHHHPRRRWQPRCARCVRLQQHVRAFACQEPPLTHNCSPRIAWRCRSLH